MRSKDLRHISAVTTERQPIKKVLVALKKQAQAIVDCLLRN
jgi:hypothetical protein